MKNDRTLALVLMIVIVGFLNADQNVMNSTLVFIEKEFRVNDAAIGLMSGLFTILGAFISIIWGYFTDKRNRKRLFAYSILLGQIPCLLTAFARNYPQFRPQDPHGRWCRSLLPDDLLPYWRHVRGEGKSLSRNVDGHRHWTGANHRATTGRLPRPSPRMEVPFHRLRRPWPRRPAFLFFLGFRA